MRCLWYTLLIGSVLPTIPSKADIYKSTAECIATLSREGSDIETVKVICNTITTDVDKKKLQDALMKEWDDKNRKSINEQWREKVEEWNNQPGTDPAALEIQRREKEKKERKECRELYRKLDESMPNKTKELDPQIVMVRYMNNYPQCR
jgi:hypothetical protein